MNMEVNLALACIVKTFLDSSAYIYEDDDVDILQLIIEHLDTAPTEENDQQISEGSLNTENPFMGHIIPSLSSVEFKSHFRILPTTFELILGEIGKKLIRTTDGNRMIPADKQLLLTLWRFATPDTYNSIIQRFNVGKATAIRAVHRVAKALCDLSSKYIVWPAGSKVQDIVHGFSTISDFPGIIGVIDDTCINLSVPSKNAGSCIKRKSNHSIHLQVVCDHTRQFTYVYVKNASSEDSLPHMSALQDYLGDSNNFPNNTHLIGDATYKLHQHLLVPYPDSERLTKRQKNYNHCHSSSRTVIERAFGLLKGRWSSLLNVLAINRMDFTAYHILACCVLHNICLLNQDEIQLQDQVIVVNVEATELPEIVEYNGDRAAAEVKRSNICANLCLKNA